jgi:hypothetical protein
MRPAVPEPSLADPTEEPRAAEADSRKTRVTAGLSAPVEPLLVDTDQAAACCGLGRATWFRAKAAGKTPAPVRILGKVLYRVDDLKLWVALGCPSRKEFEARKAASANGRPR